MKYLNCLLVFLLLSSTTIAQQKFDILWYSVPAGWEAQTTSSQLSIFSKSASAVPGQILVYPSVPAGKNPDTDFNSNWRKYVKAVYRNVADSFTVDVQNDGEWTYYSNYSYAVINRVQVVIAFTSMRSKSSILNIVQIIPNQSFLADHNKFLGGLQLDEATTSGSSHAKIFRRKRVTMNSKVPKFKPGKEL
jgi:hypothetical protein